MAPFSFGYGPGMRPFEIILVTPFKVNHISISLPTKFSKCPTRKKKHQNCITPLVKYLKCLMWTLHWFAFGRRNLIFSNLRKVKREIVCFTKDDVDNFKLIHHLVKERGFTLNGAKDKLKKHKTLYQALDYFIQGHSYEEIAELMGIAVGTVKSRLYDARKFVKENVSEEFLANIWSIGIIDLFDKLKRKNKNE